MVDTVKAGEQFAATRDLTKDELLLVAEGVEESEKFAGAHAASLDITTYQAAKEFMAGFNTAIWYRIQFGDEE